jgi:hypothetical protein
MTCNSLLVAGQAIESHLIGGTTWASARALAESCGALVSWDTTTGQAVVLPALAPDWTALSPLVTANGGWAPVFQVFQARFDYIWSASLRRRVDPRLLVAILLQEGTGSFDTNSANAAQYNGNGPDADWIADTDRAVSHVAGKLVLYAQAVTSGFHSAAQTVGYEGTVIQFLNWPGPIWQHAPNWGCYAQHAEWWQGVTAFYEKLGGGVRLLSDYWQRGPVATDTMNLRCEAVTDQPSLCSDLSGTVGHPGVVTRVL